MSAPTTEPVVQPPARREREEISPSNLSAQPRKLPIRRFTGLVGFPYEPEAKPLRNPTLRGSVIGEDELRYRFGLEEREKKPKLPESYRQLLNLAPQDIVDFFDAKVGESEELAQVDFTVPPSTLQRRIERLQKIIARSKEIIGGLSVHVMKIRRGKDDVLDKPTREKYKREESARIARSNVKLFRYRAALHQTYTEKIWCWTTKPVYFREVVDDQMYFKTVTDTGYIQGAAVLTGGLHTHNLAELVDFIKYGYFDLHGYTTLLKLDDDALAELGETEEERKETWKVFTKWENAVIRAAVCHGIITPRRDLADLLGLGSILDADDTPIHDYGSAENALAIKTGGACFGGRIKGEGYRYRGGKITPRALSSFDKPLRSMNGGERYEDPGFGSLRDYANDDIESFDAPDRLSRG